jgi:translation initiation factor 4G
LDNKFIEHYQETKNKLETSVTEITDSHNNNGHATNGDPDIIEECTNGDAMKEDDENTLPTLDEIVKSYYDLKVPEKFLKDSITKIVNESLDKGEQAHEIIIDFLQTMQKEKKLSMNQLAEALRGVISGMSEREKTIPKVTTLVASLLARCISKKISKLTDVASFTDNGQHYPLLLLVLQHLHKSIGDDPLVNMFNSSKINLMQSLPECDRTKDRLAEILDDRKLSFLQPLLRIESELWRQIHADSQPQTFYKWIKDNVDPMRYTDPGFITALMTVLLRFITQVSFAQYFLKLSATNQIFILGIDASRAQRSIKGP